MRGIHDHQSDIQQLQKVNIFSSFQHPETGRISANVLSVLPVKDSKFKQVARRFFVDRYFHLDVDAGVGLIFTLYFILFFLAISKVHFQATAMELGAPFNSFMMPQWFKDFEGVIEQWLIRPGFGEVHYGMSYFPGTYVFVEVLRLITKDAMFQVWITWKIFCAFYLSVVTGSVLLFLRPRGLTTSLMALTLVLASYPNLIALHTGNWEMLIFVLILLATLAAHAEKWSYFSIFIGIAASVKVFPGIFALAPFVLTTPKIALRSFVLSVKTAILLTLFAIFFLPGGFLSNGLDGLRSIVKSTLESQRMYSDLMVTNVAGLHYGHSLLNGIHAFFGMDFLPSEYWAIPVVIFGAIWTVVALVVIRKLDPPIWLVFGILGSSSCIFAPTSTDYKLLYLLPAVILFFRDSDRQIRSLILLLVITWAIAPKPYWYVGSDEYTNANVWLTPILLITFQIAAVISVYCPAARKSESKAEAK